MRVSSAAPKSGAARAGDGQGARQSPRGRVVTLSVASAARLAGVPRSWLRRAVERYEFRLDDQGRVDPTDVPRIRESHATSLALRGRWSLWSKTKTTGRSIDRI